MLIAGGTRQTERKGCKNCLFVQFLPVGFTAGKHASYESKDNTDCSDTSNNEPPDVIADQRWNKTKCQRAHNANDTGGCAKYDT